MGKYHPKFDSIEFTITKAAPEWMRLFCCMGIWKNVCDMIFLQKIKKILRNRNTNYNIV